MKKAALIRQPSKKFPDRKPKFFGLKIRNISAILYELCPPYRGR